MTGPGEVVEAVGVIVIGDEILTGKRKDRHFTHTVEAMQARGIRVAWCRFLGDGPQLLEQSLRETLQGPLPVVCFGGIGATPDDHTRAAAARAAGVELVRHPEAVAEIEAQFGESAWPKRVLMADLPAGSRIIPNPYNRIPGFTLGNHHFLPGFSEMAWPMLEWVADTYFPGERAPQRERSVWVRGVVESELMDLMEAFTREHPDVQVFSLPRLGEERRIELGVRGRSGVEPAFADLLAVLESQGLDFEPAA